MPASPVRPARRGAALAAALLLAAGPVYASSNVDCGTYRASVEYQYPMPELQLRLVDYGDSTATQSEDAGTQVAERIQAILNESIDDRIDAADRPRRQERPTSAPLADATISVNDPADSVDDSDSAIDDDAIRTVVPGMTEQELLQHRREMYRTDI